MTVSSLNGTKNVLAILALAAIFLVLYHFPQLARDPIYDTAPLSVTSEDFEPSPNWPSADFVARLIMAESSGDPSETGPMGERGLMQITEAAWSDRTSTPYSMAFDARLNLWVGVSHLRWTRQQLTERLGQVPTDTLVAYAYKNGVETAIRLASGEQSLSDTSLQYLSNVAYSNTSALPDHITTLIQETVNAE